LGKLKVERKQEILDSGECQKFNILSKIYFSSCQDVHAYSSSKRFRTHKILPQ